MNSHLSVRAPDVLDCVVRVVHVLREALPEVVVGDVGACAGGSLAVVSDSVTKSCALATLISVPRHKMASF